MEKEGPLRSRDLNIAAAVSLITGLTPGYEVDARGKVIFVFPDDEAVWKAVMSYHAGATCTISEYVERVKSLKAVMFATRGGGQ